MHQTFITTNKNAFDSAYAKLESIPKTNRNIDQPKLRYRSQIHT